MTATRFGRARIDGLPVTVAEIDGVWRRLDGDLFGSWRPGGAVTVSAWAAPVAPSKLVAIGRNYRDHAAERARPVPTEPMVFLKPPSAIVGAGDAIVLPSGVGRVDYEAELGVVIGRRATRVTQGEALQYVFGYTCVNDVTARDLQDKGTQWSHAKGYDSFAPIGPFIVTGLDPADVDVSLDVNGEVRQRGNTRDLIFPIDVLIAYVSAIMTLEPGDVIATGTPSGIGPLKAGDTVTVHVGGVGSLSNPVIAR